VIYRAIPVFLVCLFVFSATCHTALGAPVGAGPTDVSSGNEAWFNGDRATNLGAVLLFVGMFFVLYLRGRKGYVPYIRPIAGLMALEDAVGRAAEMGQPVLFAPGLQSPSNPATVAAMSILSKVVEKSARLRTRVKVPNYSPLTWPVSQSVAREACQKAGRPEAYDPDDIPYLTSRSFTYAAAVVGMMVRFKTASHFLIGHFYSESRFFSETGAATGAVQIGGTDAEAQLPFFITTCDYTLIGEELFAAAALTDDDPISRSTIAAHDWFKGIAIFMMLSGLILGLLGAFGVPHVSEAAGVLAEFLTEDRP
jgi:hypothetical protein